jgi:hypothetical protein
MEHVCFGSSLTSEEADKAIQELRADFEKLIKNPIVWDARDLSVRAPSSDIIFSMAYFPHYFGFLRCCES